MTARRLATAFAILVLLAVAGVCLGYRSLTPGEAIVGFGDGSALHTLLLDFRLPRVAAAILIGAILGLAGGLIQGATRNALADPGLLGLHSGSELAVITLLMLADPLTAGRWMAPASFAGAAVAALLVWGAARQHGRVRSDTLLIVGIAVSAGLGAIATAIAFLAPYQVFTRAQVWNIGSLTGLGWSDCALLAGTLVTVLLATLVLARRLDVLALGDDAAVSLGMRPQRLRLAAIAVAVVGSSLCASVCGGVAFLGLLAPNLARRIVGPANRPTLALAACCGGIILVAADILARSASTAELPTGVLVAAVGAPYFLWLLVTR